MPGNGGDGMGRKKQIDRLKQAFGLADEVWTGAAARTAPGEVACRAGCFGCCVGLFDISMPEAALVREGVARLSAPDREEVVHRSRRIVEETATFFPGDARAGLLEPERSEESDDEYFEVVADRSCPMLELPSGRCRIYEERPITCRTYGFAWARDGAVFHPPCGLNLPGAPKDRQLATAIDLGLLDNADDVDRALAATLGIGPGRETTIPHAVVGIAFGGQPGESALSFRKGRGNGRDRRI